MPIYAYRCPECGRGFDVLRSFPQADDLAPCPDCATPAQRRIAAFAAISRGANGSASLGGGRSCGSCRGGNCASCR